MGAWFVPGQPHLPAVLLLHGNGGQRQDCSEQAELLRSLGSPVLLVSLRDHDDSTGEVNDFGYSARHDVVTAVEWLEEHQPGRAIVVWGQSAGSATALFAAEELGPRAAGYILECPYRDLWTAVSNRTRLYLPPLLDSAAYSGLVVVSPLVLADVEKISPLEAASKAPTHLPVLILAGGQDTRARPDEAQAIQQRLGPKARLVVFEEADHLRLLAVDPERYRGCVKELLREAADTHQVRLRTAASRSSCQ